MHRVAFGLGANLGDREGALRAAVLALGKHVSELKTSSVYQTAPRYVVDQPAFFNMAAIGLTKLAPHDLLAHAQTIETAVGRRPTYRYGPRIVDVDILYVDDLIIDTPDLEVPHPRIAERGFVLQPLAEIAPGLIDPRNGLSVQVMLNALADSEKDGVCVGAIGELMGD